MENFVITIARQYGSGGRTVGKMLAEKLGVSFYDKQIIQMASDESGIDGIAQTVLCGLVDDIERLNCLHTGQRLSVGAAAFRWFGNGQRR